MKYFFHLGATNKLSLLELSSLLPKKNIKLLANSLAEISLDSDDQAKELMSKLGGTIKITKNIHNKEKLIVNHDWKNWIKRDRKKPYADHKKGMLPPKLARMMANIAIGQYLKTNKKNPENLFDPFCGTGTILMEAQLLGLDVFGSDIDENAFYGSKRNLHWLATQYEIANNYKLFIQDATKISRQEITKPIQLLVTEPFLGKPRPKTDKLPNIFKGLEKLYLGSFKNWAKILDNNAVLVVVFPSSETEQKEFSLSHLIDKLEGIGYSMLSKPVQYARPEAIIKRQIYLLRYVKSKSIRKS
ncbi:MAG: hypothetical protein ABFQ62_03515 [Patescibacteria group bacterium]